MLRYRHKKTKQEIVFKKFIGQCEVYALVRKIVNIHLPKIYQASFDGEKSLVVEEYINGISVADVLSEGAYSESAAANIMNQLFEVLAVLHSENIVHRDIKPENIMISSDGVVKLIDFSAARIFSRYKSNDTKALGTIGFAAPEQYGIDQSDARTDIYALGILLNILLTGQHPLTYLYPGRYRKIIEKCIETIPDNRYASVFELKKQFNKIKPAA